MPPFPLVFYGRTLGQKMSSPWNFKIKNPQHFCVDVFGARDAFSVHLQMQLWKCHCIFGCLMLCETSPTGGTISCRAVQWTIKTIYQALYPINKIMSVFYTVNWCYEAIHWYLWSASQSWRAVTVLYQLCDSVNNVKTICHGVYLQNICAVGLHLFLCPWFSLSLPPSLSHTQCACVFWIFPNLLHFLLFFALTCGVVETGIRNYQ